MTSENTEIILITEYFHPDTASTGQLMTDLAVGLQERGLDMTVYTGQPNYHSGDNERQPQVSRYEGVLVKRIRAPQFRQSSILRRLFNWMVFTFWMSVVLLVSRSEQDREIVFVSNPPFLPITLWLVCQIRGWDYTYIVHDLYPDQPAELEYFRKGGLIDRTWERLNARALLDAEKVVSLGPVMTERLANQAGPSFDVDKATVIHNWEDENFITPRRKNKNWFCEEYDLVDTFTVLYSGNIAEFHELETLIEAAPAFEDKDLQIMIIGEGDNKEKLISMAEERDLREDTVKFLPFQPFDDLPYTLTAGDVSVVAVKDGFEGVCVSSKTYTALAAGRPVLVIAKDRDDEARIVDQFDAGFNVPQGDTEGLVEAIQTWQENPQLREEQGANAREAFENHFTKKQSIDRYYELLSEQAN
ncbi:glycosyltransferase family 4 protein [Haloarcula argentinensis]|uniref:Glycosyltransferase n=1 Tax=Haloarcula argentinensis TaxID=43776 RepID=A0A847UK12_HALAR|nr:glycosyltransferase family 4 protein [Haloarcula argentinensis]NLV12627.1 glycosyltransferase [Haloarcula argentinensis]